jgi:hypothetical protein
MTLADRLIDPVLIIGAVSRKGSKRIGKLVEERASPCSIIPAASTPS